MDRLAVLKDNIDRFEEKYSNPAEGSLCRVPNVSQMAAYDGWVKERDAIYADMTRAKLEDLRKASLDHIWVLSHARYALECWYFSSEEKAKEAKEALIRSSERKEFHFNITKQPVDSVVL